MEKKMTPTLVNSFGKQRQTRITWLLLGCLFLGISSLCAAEAVKKECPLKTIASVEGRGVVNFLTSPSEFVYTFITEKKEHPKAWPLTYIPRVFTHIATRVGSSVFDILVLPWYTVPAKDDAPLTRHFDMPDYAWQKE